MPTDGPIPFIPPKDWDPNKPRKERARGKSGFVDRYNYVWVKNNEQDEWDVQLDTGKGSMDYFAKDAHHANINSKGKRTH